MTTDRPASSVDPKLLEILVCPLTKSTLEYDREKQELISRSAKLAYPIRDGIPIMLPEEARRLGWGGTINSISPSATRASTSFWAPAINKAWDGRGKTAHDGTK